MGGEGRRGEGREERRGERRRGERGEVRGREGEERGWGGRGGKEICCNSACTGEGRGREEHCRVTHSLYPNDCSACCSSLQSIFPDLSLSNLQQKDSLTITYHNE